MELRPYQQECIQKIESMPPGAYLVQMCTGLGKCFARGTKILMSDGSIKAVEEIRHGDKVMGWDSAPRIVSGLAHGTDTMYKVTPTKGEPYIVNSAHILSLKITNIGRKKVTAGDGKQYVAGDICNISVADYLKSSGTFKHFAKGWRMPVQYAERKVSLDPHLLGVWLGDGTSRCPAITTMEHEIVQEMWEYATKHEMTVTCRRSQGTGRADTYSFKSLKCGWYKNAFMERLREYDLIQNKHIPEMYLHNSERIRLELLAGLLDSDGYLLEGKGFEWSTCSTRMKNDFVHLAQGLGFYASCGEKIVNGKTYWRVGISGDCGRIPSRVTRKRAEGREQKKSVLMTGITVNPAGRGEYFGFELSGADRMFLLGDCTVAHNTVTFANIPRRGRTLLVSHREELVEQPRKYYSCSYGIERGKFHAGDEEVVSTSVQTMSRRLRNFNPDDFDTIICDEAHHAAANTYRKIFDYFKPRKLIGFTATPNRADSVRLDNVFSDIIFERDLRWGIQNGYLSDIYCRRVNIGYDLSAVHIRAGDYAPGELAEAMDGTADAVAQTYRDLAEGATLIFAVNVKQANEIANRIPGAVAVTGMTQNRAAIIEAFTRREIPCLVNCMVFTEGTDIPLVETVIIARPTQSDSLYAQMVGRGLRLSPGKERLNLIDCVGVSGHRNLCTAPSLIGIDMRNVPPARAKDVEGLLFDLPDAAAKASDCPQSWIRNVEIVDLWAKQQSYDTHGINFFRIPDGSLVCSLPNRKNLTIPCPDELGRVTTRDGGKMPMQQAIDAVYRKLDRDFADCRTIWDLSAAKRWGSAPASEKQIAIIGRRYPEINTGELTKLQASNILNRIMCRRTQ